MDEKQYHREYSRGHYQRNRQRYIAKAKNYKRETAAFIREAKNKPCADCGIAYPYFVMQFDHLHDKAFSLSRARNSGRDKVLTEIGKCEVVCANCHAVRSHTRRASPMA